MKPLAGAWPEIAERLRGRPFIVFLDFDGTLVPIRRRPGDAVMSAPQRAALRRLAARPDVGMAIVSGRGLATVRHRVALKNIVYVGNHGLEMRGPGLAWEHARARALLDKNGLRARLRAAIRGLPGIALEDKGLSLAVHFRVASPAAERAARAALTELFAGPTGRSVTMREGKKVWEIRPAIQVSKGTAVAALLKKKIWDRRSLPIFIGDDTTDEDALRVVKKTGIGIKVVGRENRRVASHAAYSVPSPAAVYRFLARLTALPFVEPITRKVR